MTEDTISLEVARYKGMAHQSTISVAARRADPDSREQARKVAGGAPSARIYGRTDTRTHRLGLNNC